LDPVVMRIHRVDTQGDGLDVTLGKFIFELGGQAQLCGAHRGKVGRVGKQYAPAIAEPLVKANAALGGILFKIRCSISKTQTHTYSPSTRLLANSCIAPALPAVVVWSVYTSNCGVGCASYMGDLSWRI